MKEKAIFAIIYEAGPNWISGKTIQEQPLESHQEYYRKLHRAGDLKLGGPFLDPLAGGLALIYARNIEAAKALVDNDPAVRGGIMIGRARPFAVLFET